MAQREKHEALRQKLNRKAAAVHQVLTTPAGQILMEALEEQFYHGAIFADDPLKTAFNLGARDVVMYLRELCAFKEKLDGRPDPLG